MAERQMISPWLSLQLNFTGSGGPGKSGSSIPISEKTNSENVVLWIKSARRSKEWAPLDGTDRVEGAGVDNTASDTRRSAVVLVDCAPF